MEKYEICNWEHESAQICEKCGFFMHNHFHRKSGFLEKDQRYIVSYPYLNKRVI